MKQIIYKGENILNVPNLISLYRLLAFPVILFMALTGRENWFVILICISLVSDIFDGSIARLFKLQTNFGAALGAFGGGAAGGLSGFSRTPEGKATVAAFMDAYNNMVISLRNYKAQEVKGGLGRGGQLKVGK